MIGLVEGLPDGVVGFEAVGEVTAEDYESVVIPAIERALQGRDRIRLLHILGEQLDGHTAGAIWDDTKLGLTNVRSFERIAVVTDLEAVRALVKGAGWSIPGELKVFSNAERADAVAWIGAGLEGRRDPGQGPAGAARARQLRPSASMLVGSNACRRRTFHPMWIGRSEAAAISFAREMAGVGVTVSEIERGRT